MEERLPAQGTLGEALLIRTGEDVGDARSGEKLPPPVRGSTRFEELEGWSVLDREVRGFTPMARPDPPAAHRGNQAARYRQRLDQCGRGHPPRDTAHRFQFGTWPEDGMQERAATVLVDGAVQLTGDETNVAGNGEKQE